MIGGIIEAVVSSILVALVFEIWNKRQALLRALRKPDPNPRAAGGEARLTPRSGDLRRTEQGGPPRSGDLRQTEEGGAPRSGDLRRTEQGGPPRSGDLRPSKKVLQKTKGAVLSIWNLFKMGMRLSIAALSGFIIGGLVAGIMEAEGYTEIALGSGISLWLIFIPTLLIWFLLYRFGPLKSKAP